MHKIVSLFFIFHFLSSCTTANKVTIPSAEEKIAINTDNKYFYNTIFKKSDFDAVKISSKINIQNIPNISATIYIENNQKIWMNISVLFMNMARGIATYEGIKAYEKIDRTYIDSDFSYLNQLLNINFLDYNALQNLLVGKVFVPINENDFDLIKNSEEYLLKSKNNQKIIVDGKTSEYKIDFKFSTHFDLIKVSLQDIKSTDQLEVFYEDWASINNQRFPKNVKIIIKGNKSKQILIENTKFEFSKMGTPYSVPANYKKRDL